MKNLFIFTTFLSLIGSNAYSLKFTNNLLEDVTFSSIKIKPPLIVKGGESKDVDASTVITGLIERSNKFDKKQELFFTVTSGSKTTTCGLSIDARTSADSVKSLNEGIFTVTYKGEGNEIKCTYEPVI